MSLYFAKLLNYSLKHWRAWVGDGMIKKSSFVTNNYKRYYSFSNYNIPYPPSTINAPLAVVMKYNK